MRSYDLTDGHDPMSHAEIDELKRLAQDLPNRPLIVNIGAADGVSTLAFLEARPDCALWSVDVEPCERELENVERGGFSRSRVIRLLGRSQDIGISFPSMADLIFVDGSHRYQDVYDDITVWLPKLKPSGIISFHDYIENPPPNNVTEAFAAVNAHVELLRLKCLGVVDRIISFRNE